MCYEYTGYGRSTAGAAPSEESCYSDIRAVMNYLSSVHGVKPKRVVLYGRSLGTAVSVRLAEVQEARSAPVRGIILHSPFASALRVACGACKTTPVGDQFVTVDRIHKLRSKVLIVHGMLDAIVPAAHGLELWNALDPSAVPHTAPLFVASAGHNNVEAVCEREGDTLIRTLAVFLTELSALHAWSGAVAVAASSGANAAAGRTGHCASARRSATVSGQGLGVRRPPSPTRAAAPSPT